MPFAERLGMASLAIVAAAALATRPALYATLLGETAGPVRLVWTLAGYFTLLTALAAAVLFGRAAITGRAPGDQGLSALALSLALVAGVYHLFLSELWDPPGIHRWADIGLHAVLPAGSALIWLWRAPGMRLGLADPARWLVWPAAYGVYAILRGALTGAYPYPFLDPRVAGIGAVVTNVAGIALAAALTGWAMWAIARLMRH